MEHQSFLEGWKTIPETVHASNGRLTEHGLRYLIRNRATNGFDHCLTKVGRSYLINRDRLERFLTGETDRASVGEASDDKGSTPGQHIHNTNDADCGVSSAQK